MAFSPEPNVEKIQVRNWESDQLMEKYPDKRH